MGEQSDIRDSRLLELLPGSTHASNVNKEAECICFFVLMARMSVVENHEFPAVTVWLLKARKHCYFVEIFAFYSLMEIHELAL